MTADLEPLEQAAARAGLPGLRARVVPYDRRRGTWFRWSGSELQVAQAVLERCPPGDAAALLVDTILERRRGEPLRPRLVAGVLLALAAGGVAWNVHVGLGVGVLALVLAGVGVWWSAARARVWAAADDDTVALLGEADALVRGFNRMNYEELRLGRWMMPARPHLHRRAERLVRMHGLCQAPACSLDRD